MALILPRKVASGRAIARPFAIVQPFEGEFEMKVLNIITLLLVIIGAVNWGLVGLFQFDLVAAIFGGQEAVIARLIYILVGLSGLYQLVPLSRALSSHDNPQLAGHP